MAFRIEIEPQALDDVDSIIDYIQQNSSLAVVEKWFNGIMKSVRSLSEMPARCAIARRRKSLAGKCGSCYMAGEA